MSHRRLLVATAALAVLAASLASAPRSPAGASTDPVVLPPSFVEAPSDSDYVITINGVELASDATGFNHWGGEMPLYASRTGLLVEADRVRVRVEGEAPFSVGIEILSAFYDEETDFFSVTSATTGIGGYRAPGAEDGTFECDTTSEVVLPVLGDPEMYWNFRRGFLVGAATEVSDGLFRFDCSLVMKPEGLGEIGTLLLEIGQPATFRAEAASYLSFETYNEESPIALRFEAEPGVWTFDDGTEADRFAALLTGSECNYRDGQVEADLAEAIFDGAEVADVAAVLDCPDGRIDLYGAGNEAHVLSVYPNFRSFSADLDEWLEGDSADGPFDGFGTLRVPSCDDVDALPCLEQIDEGWGLNLTDFSFQLPESDEVRPGVELGLIRVAEDPDVGYGTVASEDASGVAFRLRIPTGTVRGADWSDMARGVGYSFAAVAAYGFSVVEESAPGAGDGHVVLSASLEPRARSVALNSSNYAFECEVFVSGGVSEASDGCDLPDDVLEIERLAMFPRAWVSGQPLGSSEYGQSIKVMGWRLDTVEDCDPDDSPHFECSEVPGTTYTTTQIFDRVYDHCGQAIQLSVPVEGASEVDFSSGVPTSLLTADCGLDALPTGAYLGVRWVDGSGPRTSEGRLDPRDAVRLTDENGAYLLLDDEGSPLPLSRATEPDGAKCPPPCHPVLVPAIRNTITNSEGSEILDAASDGVFVGSTHAYTLYKTSQADRLGRRIGWLSEPSDQVGTVLEQGDTLLSLLTEGEHGYVAGDTVVLGGVQAAHLDGRTFTVLGANEYSIGIDVTDLNSGDQALPGALEAAGSPSCLRDGTGFLSLDSICSPDAQGLEQRPATLVLTTTEPHGLDDSEGPVQVTISLLGNEYDGTRQATVVDENRLAFDGSWYASRAYFQERRGTLVPGGTSRIVFTETSLTMFLDGLPEDEAAIAGGFVATNGQAFTFGEDLATGAAFDFAVAGPSRNADGDARSSDGFFQAFIPATFLEDSFGLTVAGAVNALEVNRRNAGTVGQVAFEADPEFVTGVSGVLISSEGFSYSAPYFAAERRTTPLTQEETGATRGPATLPGGTVPTVALGARTATVGGRTVVPAAPIVTTERMELSVGSSRVGLGGPGALGGLAVRSEGGQQVVELQAGSSFALTGEGFQPGSVTEVWLFSEPQLLALARVDSDGRLTGEVPLDGWSSGAPIPPGRHTLQVSGVNAGGEVVAFSVGVEVVTTLSVPTRRIVAAAAEVDAAATPPASSGGGAAAGSGASGGSSGTTPSPAPAAPTTSSEGTDQDSEAAVVTAAEPTDGGGGAMRSLGLLAGVLAAGLLAYGIVASRRRRASS